MMLIRLLVTFAVALLLCGGLFWSLWNLVDDAVEITDVLDPVRIEFSRMRRDSEPVTRPEELPDREPPPTPPKVPSFTLSTDPVANDVRIQPPTVNTRGAVQGIRLSAGSDRDVIPLVRINPEYPQRALTRDIEGWVQVQFNITALGTVRDAVVIDADPRGIFDDAVLRAIARWRYNPKIMDGEAVERVGVRTVITFEFEEDR